VLVRLSTERIAWVDDLQRARLREVAERQTRLVEELDSARDRAAVVQEELAARLSEQLNRNMYVLSIVAAVFLPLGFLTGLLGITVGGMPGEGEPGAFLVVCAILVVLAGLVLWMFRRWRML
jgi:zinc transporter